MAAGTQAVNRLGSGRRKQAGLSAWLRRQSARLSRSRKLAMVVAMAAILMVWQLAAWSLPDFLMPGVPVVAARLLHDIGTTEFRQLLLSSLGRLGSGYGFALLFGVTLGLLAGLLGFFREVLKSAIVILQSIPSIAWVPLFLILMGFGNTPIIVVIALAAFYPAALSVMNATESVEPGCVAAARIMGARGVQLLRRVYLPAVMPELLTGAQLAFGNAWRALIAAEMLIGFGKGLGRSLAYAGETADMSGVMASILCIAVLATLIDRVLIEGVKRRVLRYQYV